MLETLPKRERSCGLAECVKHALIADWLLLEELRRRAPGVLGGKVGASASLVARCAAIKIDVVGRDVREEAGARAGVARAFLNLGHTFAHAIEPLPPLVAVLRRQHLDLVRHRSESVPTLSSQWRSWGYLRTDSNSNEVLRRNQN